MYKVVHRYFANIIYALLNTVSVTNVKMINQNHHLNDYLRTIYCRTNYLTMKLPT